MEETNFEGWRCAVLRSGEMSAYVTLDVGPRVIGLEFEDSGNLFYVKPETRGRTDLTGYNGYGGHRVWTSPELTSRTYEPENSPVDTWIGQAQDENPSLTTSYGFRPLLGPSMLEKTLFVSPFAGGFELAHQVHNVAPAVQEVAPWAITVMRPGGECLIPGHVTTPMPAAAKLPSRSIVLWPYTRLDDPRYTWGNDAIRLQQNPLIDGQTKFGAFVEKGIACYVTDGFLFVKRFGADLRGQYPDFGANFEAFTRHDMLEVETLGHMRRLATGESVLHYESWFVFRRELPTGDLTAWFDDLLEETNRLRFART
ncbi:MAG: hypothetical protein IT205_08855 [Fimbriimonadaceae bacterium]|nr:hypothetical protein [Fimbriimonadaceae bacterium]